MEGAGGAPEILQHVDEVDDDGHRHVPGAGFGLDSIDLVVVAVDERDQVRAWPGSRRSASSKIWQTTVAASSTTLAVSHLLAARGPGVVSRQEAVLAVGELAGVSARQDCVLQWLNA